MISDLYESRSGAAGEDGLGNFAYSPLPTRFALRAKCRVRLVRLKTPPLQQNLIRRAILKLLREVSLTAWCLKCLANNELRPSLNVQSDSLLAKVFQ